MDEPVRLLGPNHRLVRHDIMTTPAIAKLLFGELADQACIDHIMLDSCQTETPLSQSDCSVVPSDRNRRIGSAHERQCGRRD